MDVAQSLHPAALDAASAPLEPGARRAGYPGLLANEPALVVGAITGLVDAGVILAFAFINRFNPEQETAALGFCAAATALIAALLTRGRVTPVARA